NKGFSKGQSKDYLFIRDKNIKWPNIGPLNKALYYTLQVTLGDIGTRGGLLTDKYRCVIDKSGDAITRLYALGNLTVSIIGSTLLGT
ncbi:hypothetical protein LZ31DRAFT_454326, partial [Colletotrichum somersetense]